MEPNDLFERYLQAVRKYLPWTRQADIVAELRANLESQREDREAELGRPLTEGEMIDWLKELGPPLQMAARYQPPRYLIGPAIFPLYLQLLRYVLLWVSVAYVAANVIQAIVQPHSSSWIFSVVFNWPITLAFAAAILTVIFVILEFVSERYPEKCPDFMAPSSRWSPTSLPPIEKEPPMGSKPRTFTTAVAEFVVQFALLLWLLLIPRFPILILGPGAVILHDLPLRFATVIVWFYWAIVVLNSVQLAWQGYELLAEQWRFRGPVRRLFIKAFGIVPMVILMAAPGQIYFEPWPAGSGHLPQGLTVPALNHGIFLGVTVITLIGVAQFLWDLSKLISSPRRQTSAALL